MYYPLEIVAQFFYIINWISLVRNLFICNFYFYKCNLLFSYPAVMCNRKIIEKFSFYPYNFIFTSTYYSIFQFYHVLLLPKLYTATHFKSFHSLIESNCSLHSQFYKTVLVLVVLSCHDSWASIWSCSSTYLFL
jgi:hypothetical protein